MVVKPLPTLHYQLFTTNSSLPTLHYQRFTTNDSLPTIHYQRYTTNDSLSTIHYQRRAALSNIRRTCCSCQWRRRRYDRYRTDAPRVLPKEIRRKGADRRCCPLPRSLLLSFAAVVGGCWHQCWLLLSEGARIVIEERVFGNVLSSVSPAVPFVQRSFKRGSEFAGQNPTHLSACFTSAYLAFETSK